MPMHEQFQAGLVIYWAALEKSRGSPDNWKQFVSPEDMKILEADAELGYGPLYVERIAAAFERRLLEEASSRTAASQRYLDECEARRKAEGERRAEFAAFIRANLELFQKYQQMLGEPLISDCDIDTGTFGSLIQPNTDYDTGYYDPVEI